MKTPPSSLFPLRRVYSEPEIATTIKSIATSPAAPRHWIHRTMDEDNNLDDHHPNDACDHHQASKASLAFILDQAPDAASSGSETESDNESRAPLPVAIAKRRRVSMSAILQQPVQTRTSAAQAPPPSSPDAKKGSKFCVVDGCTSRAKHARRCWRHGGSVKCKVPECINRAKSKGVCWSHGGGTICSHEDCETIAVSHGFCWAHGGGKRCQIDGCSRPAYERTDHYCTTHHKQRTRGAAATAAKKAWPA